MATITSDTYLDDGTARTSNEAWTMNGGVLTIRTDTRVHANAPANMSGTLGNTVISTTLGGGVFIDATAVRWLPVHSTSGNAPAIGTTISQGGVSGYYLGFWGAALTGAPIPSGSPLPIGLGTEITGYIKFREVTGGSFAAGSLTGISATADSADVPGWVEVVHTVASTITVPRAGDYKTRGDWFQLGVTTGSTEQVLQVPTNGGGAGTQIPAVWIETSPSSGVYEQYPTLQSAAFISANLGNDERSKFVLSLGNGQVQIGSGSVGFVPASGCKVRVPNIFLRQATSGAPATNATPNATLNNRPRFITTSAGEIDLENTLGDWYIQLSSAFKFIYKKSATFDIVNLANTGTTTTLDDVVVGHSSTLSNQTPLLITTSLGGGTISNSKFYRVNSAASAHAVSVSTSSDFVWNNVHAGIITYARNSGRSFLFNQCRNFNITDLYSMNQSVYCSTCANFKIYGLDHSDRIVGATNATAGAYAFVAQTSCDNILMDGITFGLKGLIPNVNSNLAIAYVIQSSNITIRNAGTFANPLSSVQSTSPAHLFQDAGSNDGIVVQRMYCNTRTSPFLTVNSSQNLNLEYLHGTTGAAQVLSNNTVVKNTRSASNSVTGGSAVYGSHFFDMAVSNTQGRIWVAFNEPTEASESFVTTTFSANSGFTSAGSASMPAVGDEIIFEWPHYIKGYDGFVNTANVVTGTNTGNFSYEFDIDKNDGNGFSGTYTAVTGGNLSAITGIDPVKGFKLRFRIKTVTANDNNALIYFRVTPTTTAALQAATDHPLDTANVVIDGYEVGTRIQIRDMANDVELYNDVPTTPVLTLNFEYTENTPFRLRAMYCDGTQAKKFIQTTRTFRATGLTHTFEQEDDTIYATNNIDGSEVLDIQFNDAALRIEFYNSEDSPALIKSWQEIYAFETHNLSTENGIRLKGRCITAIDPVNYSVRDFLLKSMITEPVIITNGYGVRDTTGLALDLIDTTGGTLFCAPDHVVGYATGSSEGGGDSKEAIYTYFTSSSRQNAFKADVSALATKTDLNIVNEGVQKASLLIPHNTNLT
jgi:hypothetical protein